MKITKQYLKKIIKEEVSSILSEDKRIDKGVKPMQFKISILYPQDDPSWVNPPSNDIIFIDYYNNKNNKFMEDFGKAIEESDGTIRNIAHFVFQPKMKPKALHPRTVKRVHSMVQATLTKNKARVYSPGQLVSALEKKGFRPEGMKGNPAWITEKLGIVAVTIEHQ